MTCAQSDAVHNASQLPDWLARLGREVRDVSGPTLSRHLPPADGSGRKAAVLMAFGQTDGEPDVLLLERASTMRAHAGQIAFPGGALDPGDDGPVGAALREATEEVGLQPQSVAVFGQLPALYLPVTDYVVTPVLAWWRDPHPVEVRDAAEVSSVRRVPLATLAEPANRLRVNGPNGYLGYAFTVQDWLVWGFTAGLLHQLLRLGGWERPWHESALTLDLPEVLAWSAARE